MSLDQLPCSEFYQLNNLGLCQLDTGKLLPNQISQMISSSPIRHFVCEDHVVYLYCNFNFSIKLDSHITRPASRPASVPENDQRRSMTSIMTRSLSAADSRSCLVDSSAVRASLNFATCHSGQLSSISSASSAICRVLCSLLALMCISSFPCCSDICNPYITHDSKATLNIV